MLTEENDPTSESPSYESESGLKTITQVKPLSYHIMIKLVVDDILINKIVLLDSGVDRNCIQEGLVLTKYLTKGTTSLYSATGESIRIKYLLHNAHICNNEICLKNDFIITETLMKK